MKKAEHRRIDAFELWCWRRLLRVPCTARRYNQSILKECCVLWVFFGSNDAKAETPVLWPPHVKSWPWCWEGLGAGGEGDNRGWDGLMASLTRWTRVWVNSRIWWWTGRPGMLQLRSPRVEHDWVTELNWTELMHSMGEKENFSLPFLDSFGSLRIKLSLDRLTGEKTHFMMYLQVLY